MMMPLTCLTWQTLNASLMEMLQICLMLKKMLMVLQMLPCAFSPEAQGGWLCDLESFLRPWRGGVWGGVMRGKYATTLYRDCLPRFSTAAVKRDTLPRLYNARVYRYAVP